MSRPFIPRGVNATQSLICPVNEECHFLHRFFFILVSPDWVGDVFIESKINIYQIMSITI